jgi:hypothetical protein
MRVVRAVYLRVGQGRRALGVAVELVVQQLPGATAATAATIQVQAAEAVVAGEPRTAAALAGQVPVLRVA